MGVRINSAGHYIAAAGVDHVRTDWNIKGGSDRGNRRAVDQHIGAARMIVVHDRTAADQDGHRNLPEALGVDPSSDRINLARIFRAGEVFVLSSPICGAEP
jgi:hypothetical protein